MKDAVAILLPTDLPAPDLRFVVLLVDGSKIAFFFFLYTAYTEMAETPRPQIMVNTV